jgi:V8-like Glu-specific endopeptidase
MSWESELRHAARAFDWPAVTELSTELVRHLRTSQTKLATHEAKSILGLLRESRRAAELLRVADAMLVHGIDNPAIVRHLAQTLVDGENPAAALRLFSQIERDPNASPDEQAEAAGGVGRAYKQMYILDESSGRRARYLQLALAKYRAAYEQARFRTWLGINVVALLARAGRDGIGLADYPDPVAASQQLAAEILAAVEADSDLDAWDLATAAEACVALGRHDEAVVWAHRFAEARDADAFKLASTLRQFLQVWELDVKRPPGDGVLPALQSALLAQDGGEVRVPLLDVRADRLEDIAPPELERVFGATRFKTLTWYKQGLERCRAVVRVEDASEAGHGTGFLVEGPSLHPALPPLVVVTNGHVIPEGIEPRDAVVAFRGLEGDPGARLRFRVLRSWWYEPSAAPGLDATVIELDGVPENVIPIPLAATLPSLTAAEPPRAYVIGHPRGLAQPQFTLQDNVLLDHDDVHVHYRSATEPGSSGSPVFNNNWELIALHHGGGYALARLKGKGGTYPANEGIAVPAIRSKLASRSPLPEDVTR